MFLDRFFEDSAALYPDSIAIEQGEHNSVGVTHNQN